MTTKYLFIKNFKNSYSGVNLGIDSTIFEYMIFTFFLIPLMQREDFQPDTREIIIGSLAGCLMASGRIFISMAVSLGLAAPAQALMSTHSLHQALWSTIIAGQTLTLL